MSDRRSQEDDWHGTYAGYQRHQKAGEKPCESCRAAGSAYMRQYRKAKPEKLAAGSRQQKIRYRAMAELARRHQTHGGIAMTANAYLGKPKPTAPSGVSVPSPSSLCPQCATVEADSKHYLRGQVDEVLYVCAKGHGWLVRWVEAA